MKTLSFLLCLDSGIHLFYSKCGLFKSVQFPLIILDLFIFHTWPFLRMEESSGILLSSKNHKGKGGTLWLKNNKQITKPMPCEMMAQGLMRPQTLFPPVFPGLLGILGALADGISCQNIAGTTWYKTTKGTVGQAARQADTMNAQRAATPFTSCCVPKTPHLSVCHTAFPS